MTQNKNIVGTMSKLSRVFAAVVIIIIAVVVYNKFAGNNKPKENTPLVKVDKVRIHNEACYERVQDDMFTCIAYIEGFREKPYHCGAKWTIGYGSTVYPDGKRVTRKSKPISKSYAKECVYAHLDKYVKPFIMDHVKRELSDEEMLGIALFIYNVGGENFSGYDKDGKVVGKASSFLKSINRNDNSLETAKKMTGFRRSAGKRANGLLKRHWVVAGLYTGILTPNDILDLQPELFYKPNEAFYYKKRGGDFWEYNFKTAKVEQFKRNNTSKKNVRAII